MDSSTAGTSSSSLRKARAERFKKVILKHLAKNKPSSLVEGRQEGMPSGYASLTPSDVAPKSSSSLPVDAVPPGTNYCQQDCPEGVDLRKGVEVRVSFVDTPSHLWIQFVDPETTMKLSKLEKRMESFYAMSETQSSRYKIPDDQLEVGLCCAAPLFKHGVWCRAKIFDIPNDYEVDIIYVDHGGIYRVPNSSLRYLSERFLVLPAQAVESELAWIRPAGGQTWTPKAKNLTMKFFGNRTFTAYMEGSRESDIKTIVLYDTDGTKDTFVNKHLVSKRIASWQPTFELENLDNYIGTKEELKQSLAGTWLADLFD